MKDFADLPADIQLLRLNLESRILKGLLEIGPNASMDEKAERVMTAIFSAQRQTIADCGGVAGLREDGVQMLGAGIPRHGLLYPPED